MRPLLITPARGVLVHGIGGARIPAVLVRDGRIRAHGSRASLAAQAPDAVVLAVDGVALPGFRDHHLHFLGLASRLVTIDCAPGHCASNDELVDLLRSAAPGIGTQWIRAGGYEHRAMRDRKPVDRWDLDRAVGPRPMILRHRSGHVAVLNSAALASLGLDDTAPVFDGYQHDERGRLTGIVHDGEADLRARGLPRLSPEELAVGAERASHALARAGITWFADLGANNDAMSFDTLTDLTSRGVVRQRWAMFEGLTSFESAGERRAFAGVKIMIDRSISSTEIADALYRAERAGLVTAIHAVDEAQLAVALDAHRKFAARAQGRGAHRVEHAFSCPPSMIDEIRDAGLTVVTQPGFLYEQGDRYLAEPDLNTDWLFPLAAFRSAGVRLLGSSDAPAGPLAPLLAIQAAMTRRTRAGRVVGEGAALRAGQAFGLYAALAPPPAGETATLAVGAVADLVVLDQSAEPGCEVRAVVMGGSLLVHGDSIVPALP